LKALATVGAVATDRVPVAGVPVKGTGPVAAGAPVVFTFVFVAVTLCVIVQLPPGNNVPELKPTEVPPLTPPVKVALLPALQLRLPAALLTSVPV